VPRGARTVRALASALAWAWGASAVVMGGIVAPGGAAGLGWALAQVATRSYTEPMQTVGIRELKNRLSHYLRMVRKGERVLVTDRGEVVAEVRGAESTERAARGLEALVRRGLARPGDRNDPDLYPRMPAVLPQGEAQRLLDLERGSR
jgi:prevent-host-death family protein